MPGRPVIPGAGPRKRLSEPEYPGPVAFGPEPGPALVRVFEGKMSAGPTITVSSSCIFRRASSC